MSFVHLHVHSSYSILDGFGKPSELVAQVKALGMPAVALTDHGTMFGTIDFFKAATKAGIKPIIGLEAYLAPRTRFDKDVQKDRRPFHLLLLAENMVGYHNLLKIASVSQLEGFYYHPRIDRDFLRDHHEGIIAASACLSGEIPRALLEEDTEKAERALDWYRSTFGDNNFFLELQKHDLPELDKVNEAIIELAKKTGTGLIATNDVHYLKREDAELQDILLAVQTGKLLSDPSRMKMGNDTYYLRSPQEMAALFSETPEAIANTLQIAERCHVDLHRKGYHLPKFEIPKGYETKTYLEQLCQEGLKRRIPQTADSSEVQQRLEHELKVIHEMGFDAYFLIVWDLCQFSREQGIWYNVRGSGNGSMVAFALNITSVNPLDYNLLFERFLNPNRITMPDIDLDFQDDRRAEVMEYCNQKYGSDKVAQIITFGQIAARGAIRDVGRVMDIPLAEVDRVAKLVPGPVQGKNQPISNALETVSELRAIYESSDQMKKLIDTAGRLEGAIRNLGTHAAGVIISDEPLTQYLPLHRPTSQSDETPIRSVTQFEMDVINDLGLLKVDFLGLVTLTIMARACDLIAQRHGKHFDLDSIPIDDPEVFKFISEGHTVGLFQMEGTGMTRYIMQMRPQTVNHVIAIVALFRPGPMEIIPNFIERMHGRDPVNYQHPLLEPILNETYGHAVYQEQIMLAAMKLANYSAADSDDLRSAISKKKEKEVAKHHSKFVEGAKANGIQEATAEAIWAHWEAFAHYGFNKSHATNYGMIAVKTAYLKRYYPAEYMTALLSAWKNDTEKCAAYVAECRALGLEVLPPDVNSSGYDFTIADRPDGKASIRFGLGAVKNVGQAPVDQIMAARGNTPFSDINNFVRRVDLRSVGKRPLECLIKVGALDAFGSRYALLRAIDTMVSVSTSHFKALESGQMMLFGSSNEAIGTVQLGSSSALHPTEQLEWEKELLGIYVTDNPISSYMSLLTDKITHLSSDLADLEKDERVTIGGVVKKVRPLLTRKNENMGFVTIEDNIGEMDLVVFPRVWEANRGDLETGAVLFVQGKADPRDQGVQILVDKITRLRDADAQMPANNRNKGPFYEQLIERYLPNMRVLSRFAWHPMGDLPLAAEELEELNDFDIPLDLPEEPEWEDERSQVMERVLSYDLAPELEDLPETQMIESPGLELGSMTADEPAATIELEPDLPTDQQTKIVQPDLVITISSCGEPEKDLRRIRNMYGYLCSHPGDGRFAFHISEHDNIFVLEFPNDRIELSETLRKGLRRYAGPEDVFTWRD